MKIELGYLIDISKDTILNAETLTECVWYGDLGRPVECRYIYDSDNNKVYLDGAGTLFYLNARKVRTDLSDLNTAVFKKIVNEDGKAIYQALNSGKAGKARKVNVTYSALYEDTNGTPYSGTIDIVGISEDVSARNYYYESIAFSNWVYNNLSNIKIGDIKINEDDLEQIYPDVTDLKGLFGDPNQPIFSSSNPEDENSAFWTHKNEVIKQSIITNLNQAITSYSGNSAGNYQLPVLTDTDWDQILRNVSIVTFVQGIPIGLKEYNNYVVATSTANKEYVNPDEIYLIDISGDDKYYHRPYCSKLTSMSLIGYRNIDYVIKSKEGGRDTGDSLYFYKQSIGSSTPRQACYYCIVQKDLFDSIANEDIKKAHEEAYETALARERYVSHKFK